MHCISRIFTSLIYLNVTRINHILLRILLAIYRHYGRYRYPPPVTSHIDEERGSRRPMAAQGAGRGEEAAQDPQKRTRGEA